MGAPPQLHITLTLSRQLSKFLEPYAFLEGVSILFGDSVVLGEPPHAGDLFLPSFERFSFRVPRLF